MALAHTPVPAVPLAVISMQVEWVQGVLLAEMSDGQLAEFKLWAKPTFAGIFRWKTREQIVELCRSHNCETQMRVRENLHLDKERRFGHNYQARGY